MPKVLIVIAHPNLEGKSFATKAIIDNVKKLNPETEFDDLYQLYPDYKIDVKKEQEKLLKADVVILQYPMYWYNTPSLLRKWFEDVLEHGFAYGSKGVALKDKRLILSFTVGAPLEAYKQGGSQNITLDDLTKGFNQLANLCRMKYEGYVATGGLTFFIKDKEEEHRIMIGKLEEHAKKLIKKTNE